MGFNTTAIHGGFIDNSLKGVNYPIYLSSTFIQPDVETEGPYCYSRGNNPSRACVEKLAADVEGAKYGIATASGMAATSAIIIPAACVIALPGSLIETDIQVSPLPNAMTASVTAVRFLVSLDVVYKTTCCTADITPGLQLCQARGTAFTLLSHSCHPASEKGPVSRPPGLFCIIQLSYCRNFGPIYPTIPLHSILSQPSSRP